MVPMRAGSVESEEAMESGCFCSRKSTLGLAFLLERHLGGGIQCVAVGSLRWQKGPRASDLVNGADGQS